MKPGIYDMPAAEYHSGPGVSKSMLDRIAQSPAHLRAYLDSPKDDPTPSMLIGTLTHLAVFEPDLFGEGKSHHVKPEGMSFVSKDGKAWRDAHQDKPILSIEDAAGIKGMVHSVRNHPMVSVILKKGSAEQSMYAVHQETGVLRRGRADWLTEDATGRPCIADLKTTDDAREFERKAAGFRYHVQNAYYADILDAVGVSDPAFLFIVVERNAPFGVRVVQFDTESVDLGRATYEREIALFADCQERGEWPGYDDEITTVSLPGWVKKL